MNSNDFTEHNYNKERASTYDINMNMNTLESLKEKLSKRIGIASGKTNEDILPMLCLCHEKENCF